MSVLEDGGRIVTLLLGGVGSKLRPPIPVVLGNVIFGHNVPIIQLDDLSFLEAQIQLGMSSHFLRFLGYLRYLLYPPEVIFAKGY